MLAYAHADILINFIFLIHLIYRASSFDTSDISFYFALFFCYAIRLAAAMTSSRYHLFSPSAFSAHLLIFSITPILLRH